MNYKRVKTEELIPTGCTGLQLCFPAFWNSTGRQLKPSLHASAHLRFRAILHNRVLYGVWLAHASNAELMQAEWGYGDQ